MTERIEITEVGPRDGLQNEDQIASTAAKIALVSALADAGAPRIEVSSFVRPGILPQLADAEEVFADIERRPGTIYSALVPNARGWQRAAACRVDEIAVITAASATFSERNTNIDIDGSLARIADVLLETRAAGIRVRGYVSCVIACPYEGPTDPAAVRVVVDRLVDAGVDDIALGETLGVAGGDDIERLYEGLAGVLAPEDSVLHLHDTRGQALECVKRGVGLGVRRFDAACGGLGGCPFAPGAAGNLATEALVEWAEGQGISTGIDAAAVTAAVMSVRTSMCS